MTALSRALIAAAAAAATAACGSSSPSAPSNPSAPQNSVTFTIDAGPANNYFNGGFVSVTVCVPGTGTCQTIDGVLIDTGSSGLRVLQSALTIPLKTQTTGSGNAVVECSQFLDGFTWGPVQTADVKMAGETASSIPIQAIGETDFPTIPADCTNTGTAEDTLDTLGANGILGIGLFLQDCGPACAVTGASNPGMYYQCASGTCTVTPMATNLQVPNPVAMFSHDNNGVALTIAQVTAPGAITATGTLTFGIGTQSNNGLGSAHVLTTNGQGNISTVFRGQTYDSFIDSGSNGYFFLDSATTGIPTCTDAKDFYCPSTPQQFTATNRGVNGTSTSVAWTVDNADTIPQNLNVLPTIGGTSAGSFDWGLPFFFGRTVFTAIEGQSTPGGVGPVLRVLAWRRVSAESGAAGTRQGLSRGSPQ